MRAADALDLAAAAAEVIDTGFATIRAAAEAREQERGPGDPLGAAALEVIWTACETIGAALSRHADAEEMLDRIIDRGVWADTT